MNQEEFKAWHEIHERYQEQWSEVPAAKSYYERADPIANEILGIIDDDAKLGTAMLLSSLVGLRVITPVEANQNGIMVRAYWKVFISGKQGYLIADLQEDQTDAG